MVFLGCVILLGLQHIFDAWTIEHLNKLQRQSKGKSGRIIPESSFAQPLCSPERCAAQKVMRKNRGNRQKRTAHQEHRAGIVNARTHIHPSKIQQCFASTSVAAALPREPQCRSGPFFAFLFGIKRAGRVVAAGTMRGEQERQAFGQRRQRPCAATGSAGKSTPQTASAKSQASPGSCPHDRAEPAVKGGRSQLRLSQSVRIPAAAVVGAFSPSLDSQYTSRGIPESASRGFNLYRIRAEALPPS